LEVLKSDYIAHTIEEMKAIQETPAKRARLYDEDFCEWTHPNAQLLRAGHLRQADMNYTKAANLAEIETGLTSNPFPVECPFILDQIFDRNFLP